MKQTNDALCEPRKGKITEGVLTGNDFLTRIGETKMAGKKKIACTVPDINKMHGFAKGGKKSKRTSKRVAGK